MSKRLPYFQFEPAEYLTKDVSFCSLAAQGLFINICSFYWQRDCDLTIEQVNKRFRASEQLEELLKEDVIKSDEGVIVINFLNLQFQKAIEKSQRNSKNGSKGGARKGNQNALKNRDLQDENKRKTSGKQAENKQKQANKIRKEEKKEYKKKKLSELKNSDEWKDDEIFNITLAFQDLFIINLKEAGASTVKVENALGAWIDPVRLMIEKDGYTLDQMRSVYEFLQKDEFWKSNILSTKKLRIQIEKLLMKIKSTKNGTENRQQNQGVSSKELADVFAKNFIEG